MILQAYNKCYKQKESIRKSLNKDKDILQLIENIQPKIKLYSLLQTYIKTQKQYMRNKELLSKVEISDTKSIILLQGYLKQQSIKNNSLTLINKTDKQLQAVQEQISAVNVCPLCNQPICNH
jgi:hypothetical protein